MGSGNSKQPRTGSYLGTGVLFNLDVIGYTPKRIEFTNQTTGAQASWNDTMDDDSVRTSDSGVDAFATSDGVIPRSQGVSIGTNGIINTLDDRVHYSAHA